MSEIDTSINMIPLRVCLFCGLVAYTKKDLNQFIKSLSGLYGRQNTCKKCASRRTSERLCRTTEFVEVFREMSPDGVLRCYFCEEEITKLSGRDMVSLNIHSLDGDHDNWSHNNKVPTHKACHTRYHRTGYTK